MSRDDDWTRTPWVPSLGLLAAEDALNHDVPRSASRRNLRLVLECAALDLDLAEAEIAGAAKGDPDLHATMSGRLAEARRRLRHLQAQPWEERAPT